MFTEIHERKQGHNLGKGVEGDKVVRKGKRSGGSDSLLKRDPDVKSFCPSHTRDIYAPKGGDHTNMSLGTILADRINSINNQRRVEMDL
jgi:hypothetical protein